VILLAFIRDTYCHRHPAVFYLVHLYRKKWCIPT